jgi:predicted hotdog family 3-hydroxylacyl-ACP dehydratase
LAAENVLPNSVARLSHGLVSANKTNRVVFSGVLLSTRSQHIKVFALHTISKHLLRLAALLHSIPTHKKYH